MHLCVCVCGERERETLYHDQLAATTTITTNKIHLLRGCDDKIFLGSYQALRSNPFCGGASRRHTERSSSLSCHLSVFAAMAVSLCRLIFIHRSEPHLCFVAGENIAEKMLHIRGGIS